MARLELVVSARQDGRTVRSLLKGELGLSTTRINRLKRTESGLTVNGVRVFTNAVLHEGDFLVAELDAAERPSALEPVPMALEIRYEDSHLLILDKPAPLAGIPSSLAPHEPSLASGLAHYLGPNAAIHPVNRLDRGTTGLMAVAKNGWVHDILRRQLHSGAFSRRYLAICVGVPQPKRQIDPYGQAAVTDYRVLETAGALSLVELSPRTGRTHQIRVHMSSLGCPLAGDWLYGVEDRTLIARPALHAGRLELTHPVTGRPVSLTAPLPADMKKLLER